MEQEGEISAGCAFVFQNGERVVIGVAGVDANRHAAAPGGADLAAEHVCLHIAWRPVVKIIEAGFADRNDLGVRNEVENRLFLRQILLGGGVVRVGADRAPDVLAGFGQCQLLWRARQAGADGDEFPHAGLPGACQDLRRFFRCVVIEVAVRIDQHQGPTQLRRRNAEIRRQVAAGCCRPAAE